MAEDKCLALISETNKPFNVQACDPARHEYLISSCSITVRVARQGLGACSSALPRPRPSALPATCHAGRG